MAIRPSKAFLSLRTISTTPIRQLHLTGPATFSSPIVSTSKQTTAGLPRDIAALQNEARNPSSFGSKNELVDHTSNISSFSTAAEEMKQQQSRNYNTSRVLKAVNDSSTMDFTYLPMVESESEVSGPAITVPLLPQTYTSRHVKQADPEIVVIRPMIVTASADSNASAMSDVHDNSAVEIDFHGLADRLSSATAAFQRSVTRHRGNEVETGQSTLKQLWNGLLDDMLGARKGATAA